MPPLAKSQSMSITRCQSTTQHQTSVTPSSWMSSSSVAALLAEHEGLKGKLVAGSATAAEEAEFAAVLAKLEDAKAEDAKAVRVKMVEIDKMLALVEAAERVDLCFVIDATASMHRYIVAVKRQILASVGGEQCGNLRLGLLPLRLWKLKGAHHLRWRRHGRCAERGDT